MAGNPNIRCINPPDAPLPGGHYSHSATVGNLVFVAGQLPVAASGQHEPAADFATQAQRTLANLQAALAAAGSSPGSIVKLTAYVTDIGDWPLFDSIYAGLMGDHRPARCVVPVPALHHGYRIEIEAIALLDGKP